MSVTFTAELTGDPVDMNNSNAVRVLDTLGYAGPYGDEHARLFLGRVLLAFVLDPPTRGAPPSRAAASPTAAISRAMPSRG
ncbi:hypothetical protein OG729_39240 [Streptomyces sp. NBC_00210]|uniref:hypothetical protein n=1 Tax=unclassified Streptomyces TaxID=2593676 RepID=UPI003248AB2E